MRLEQQLPSHPCHLHRLVHQPHFGTDRCDRKQRRNILRVHADAAMQVTDMPTAVGLLVP